MKLHTSIKDGFLYSASAVRLGVITVISFNIRKKSQIIKRMHTFTYYINNLYYIFRISIWVSYYSVYTLNQNNLNFRACGLRVDHD